MEPGSSTPQSFRRRLAENFALILVSAIVAAVAASWVHPGYRNPELGNGTFLILLSLGLLWRGRANRPWIEAYFVASSMFAACALAAAFLGLSLYKLPGAGLLFLPIDHLAYYPPGADAPLLFAAPIWVVSMLGLCGVAALIGLSLGALVRVLVRALRRAD